MELIIVHFDQTEVRKGLKASNATYMYDLSQRSDHESKAAIKPFSS